MLLPSAETRGPILSSTFIYVVPEARCTGYNSSVVMTGLNYAKLEPSLTLQTILRIRERMLETSYRNPIQGFVTLTSTKGTLKLFGNIRKQSPRKVCNQPAVSSFWQPRTGKSPQWRGQLPRGCGSFCFTDVDLHKLTN